MSEGTKKMSEKKVELHIEDPVLRDLVDKMTDEQKQSLARYIDDHTEKEGLDEQKET